MLTLPSALRRSLSFSALLALGVVAAGCTVAGGGNRDSGVGTGVDANGVDAPIGPSGPLRIEPANQVVTLSGSPITIDYHAFYTPMGGTETEVTSECAWSSTVDALGSFTGSTFTTNLLGGATSITCVRGSDTATTRLTITGDTVVLLPDVPADVPDRFGGTVDPSLAPEFVYPADHVMVPPNLGELEFHFMPNGGEYFELAFTAPTARVRIFMGCPEAVGGGCAYVPAPAVWAAVSTALAGLGEVTYTLRSVNAAGVVGESAPRSIRVAAEQITGGLYYWNTAGTIDRFEFGVRGARAEAFITQARAMAGVCVGCHSLSRDGTRIAIGTDIPTTTFQVFDVATRSRLFSLGGGFPSQPGYFSFDPGSPPTQIVTSGVDGLAIRDVNTGTPITSAIGARGASMPDWAPDGDRIVFASYTAPPIPFESPFITGGRIEMATRTGGGAWTVGATPLVAGGGNNYYPAFSPNGEWIVFSRSPSNMANGGDDGAAGAGDAQLWLIRADGSSPEIRLDTADFPGDSWAKWDPTLYLDGGSSIFWLTWSSTRAFGLRWPDNGGTSQLWMAAFDESRALAGEDPVIAAFRLPFQDAASGNHIAQWVTHIERLGCTTDVECGGEFCVDGRCYETPPGPF